MRVSTGSGLLLDGKRGNWGETRLSGLSTAGTDWISWRKGCALSELDQDAISPPQTKRSSAYLCDMAPAKLPDLSRLARLFAI